MVNNPEIYRWTANPKKSPNDFLRGQPLSDYYGHFIRRIVTATDKQDTCVVVSPEVLSWFECSYYYFPFVQPYEGKMFFCEELCVGHFLEGPYVGVYMNPNIPRDRIYLFRYDEREQFAEFHITDMDDY